MKVLYDHQIFTSQIYGGVSRYFYELMNSFNENKKIDFELSLKYSNNNYIENNKFLNQKTFLKNINFRGKTRLLSFINNQKSKNLLLKQDFDIFHPTYYDPYYLTMNIKKPIVVTVYDMIHELFPRFFHKDKTTNYKKKVLGHADKIIAISESTKNDLCDIFKINPDKVSVIYLGTSFPNIRSKPLKNIPKEYFLFVGARRGYKNFNFMVRAIADILKTKRLSLICVGGGKFTIEEKKLLDELKIENNVIQMIVADSELKFLYQNAIAFVFPSLYEGFGMPVLEAFSCGCPVLLSNSSSFPEVAGDAVIYFNPKNKESILKTVSIVLDEKFDRESFVSKGYIIANNFTWDKTARQTLDIYKELI